MQITYARIKRSYFKILKPSEDGVDKVEEKSTPKDPVDINKEKVKAAHRLLRNFNYAVNVQVMDREEDKRVFPLKFSAKMEGLFDDKESLEKFKKALQTDFKESVNEIPDKLSEKTLKGVVEFLEQHEKVEVIDKLEVQLEDLTKQIDEKRSKLDVLRPKRKTDSTPSSGKSKKSKASSKKSSPGSDQDDDLSAEDKFRVLIKEVNQRVKAVKIKKDDFELFLKMQQELDAFLHEAITEIKGIKTRFKQRFDDIQSGKRADSRSRSRSRKPMRRSRI